MAKQRLEGEERRILKQAARFSDAAMAGVTKGEGGLNPQVEQMLGEADTGDPGQLLGQVAGEIGAAALAGNLAKGVALEPPAAVLGTQAIVDQLGDLLRQQAGMEIDQASEAHAMQVAVQTLFQATMGMDSKGNLNAEGGTPYWDPEMLGSEALALLGEGGSGASRLFSELGVPGGEGAPGQAPAGPMGQGMM